MRPEAILEWTALLEIGLAAAFTVAGANAFAGEPATAKLALPNVDASPQFVDDLRALLDLGLKPNRKQVAEAESRYEALHRARPEDPRVDFAYSLVLARMMQPVEARKALEAAAARPEPYWPARQLLIRELVKLRKFQEAGEQLTGLARELSNDDSEAPAIAQWMGRVVACVMGPVGSRESREQFQYLDVHLRTSLPAVLLAAYDRGFQRLELEVDDLRASIELVQMQSETTAEAAKTAAERDLAKTKSQLLAKQGAADAAGKKWDEWLGDETKKIDELLIEMEKRFQELENSATAQQVTVAALRLQMDRIDRGIDQAAFSNLGIANIRSNVGQRAAVDGQLAIEESKLSLIYAAQQELSSLAAMQLAGRKDIVAQYQQATGQILQEQKSLKTWGERARKIAEREKKEADKKPAGLMSLEARVKSLNTYDPFDFKIERERLLAEFGVFAAAPAAAE